MLTTRIARRSSVWLVLGLLFVDGRAVRAGEAPALPRYHLTPGQELSYRSVTRSERKGGESVYKVDWKAWVVGRDADGAWRLVLRCDLRITRPAASGAKKAEEGPADTLVWRCRLFDDGRLVGATTRGNVRDPFRLFPRLPDDAGAQEWNWNFQGQDQHPVHLRFRTVTPPDPSHAMLVFTTTSENPMDKVYVETHSTRSTFDPRRGLVTRLETKDTFDLNGSEISKGTIELVSVEDRGSPWAEDFGREADAYFDAAAAYESATHQAARDPKACKALLAEAKAKLEKVRAALTAPVFREAIDQDLTKHDRMARYLAEEASHRAEFLGKPAADWEAKDLDGKTHRLADYRGKVVLLDFWYRRCGWCMHAMPQVKQLAETFRDQPVAVLGMTIDEDVKDARVVVEAMDLHYPVICAQGLPTKYGVDGYPTLIVIDPRGKVREVHVGYSSRLFEELSELVRNLLAENASP